MDIKERATELHHMGYNCAQSVFVACGEYTGLDEKQALAISAGFGGGLRCGEVCGAVSGAVMAIGTCCPYNDCENLEAKAKIAALAKEFCEEFKNHFDNIRCVDLKRDGHVPCDELIAYAAEIAEKTIKLNK